MNKKIPWWRKPDKKDEDEEHEEEADEDKKFEKRKQRPYGRRREDRFSRREPFFESPFDDELDHFFSRSPFRLRDDLFGDMEREFEEMHMKMDKVFKQAMEGKLEKPGSGGPFVYGFSMRTGPDGIPHIQEFGNVNPELMKRLSRPAVLPFKGSGDICNSKTCSTGELSNEAIDSDILGREPLTDIIEHDKKICITMELPGIEKKDINLETENGDLVVHVDTPHRKYHKKLQLSSEVDPKTICATYKNGVLDISINRLRPKPKKGKRIKISESE